MTVATNTNSALRRVVGLIWKNLLLVTSRLPTRKSCPARMAGAKDAGLEPDEPMGLPELAGPITSKTKFGSRRRAVRHAAPSHAGYTIALRRPPAFLGHERNGQPQPFTWTKHPKQNHR